MARAYSRLPSNVLRAKEIVRTTLEAAEGPVTSKALMDAIRKEGIGATPATVKRWRKEFGAPATHGGKRVAPAQAAASTVRRAAVKRTTPSEVMLRSFSNEYLVACTKELNRRVVEAAKLLDLAREE